MDLKVRITLITLAAVIAIDEFDEHSNKKQTSQFERTRFSASLSFMMDDSCNKSDKDRRFLNMVENSFRKRLPKGCFGAS